jgi:hypothetical protein
MELICILQTTWAFPQMNDQEALHALPHHHWFHAQALKNAYRACFFTFILLLITIFG